ncbi:MAG: glutamate--cysteine ligase [Gammaproteobacteria bacterium]
MGQEIDSSRFTPRDFEEFARRLKHETELLITHAHAGGLSSTGPVAGFELEAWLVNARLEPAPVNEAVLKTMADPLATLELAKFNIELNVEPELLMGRALSGLEAALKRTWTGAHDAARQHGAGLLTIGILPTLRAEHLSLANMSGLKRYRALNRQVLRARDGRPLKLDIVGHRHLKCEHNNILLESATASFQIHLQAPFERAHRLYNAAIAISAPMVAAGANAPYLFGQDLWSETRIPLFEQSVEVGGFNDVAQGPLRRVSFGSGYASDSILECFTENLEHFPVLLPTLSDDPSAMFAHLRLHNGTIWRWNRPLIGFDADGTPHVRIEHRVLAGSPTIADAVADAALFYGLAESLCTPGVRLEARLPFAQAKDNFYQAARFGLSASVSWLDGKKTGIRALLLNELLPLARRGLHSIGIEPADCDHYLGVVMQRVEQSRNGAGWQRAFVARHGPDMQALTAAYIDRQRRGEPVHTWHP